jgi:hypothetical protein
MDDMFIFEKNDYMIKSTKKMLTNKFDMKDSSVVDVVLGIKIIKTSNKLVWFESHYIKKILDKIFKGEITPLKH